MRFVKRHWIAGLLALATMAPLTLGVSGCSTNPATGENEFTLISRSEEKQIGAEGDAQIVAEFGLYDDQQIAAWVSEIGQEVAQASGDAAYGYTFRVLDTDVINAFALPGGYIYVTRGLLAYLQNEAQLAMILGHEVAHVTARHSAKQYTSQVLAQVGVGVGSIFFEDIEPFLGAVGTGLQLLFLKYSRDDETQADQFGVRYATKAGYEASEGAEFFVTLDRLSAEAGETLPTFLSTHPNPADREEKIIQWAAEEKAQAGGELGGTNPAEYLPRLDNIVFGQNPRHGFVANSTFYHPDLRLQFPVPSGWLVGNFATQVQMVPQNQEAVVVFTAANESSPAAAANAFAAQQGVSVIDSRATTVNGFDAARLRTTVQVSETEQVSVLSYFIRKDQTVYVFHGYTTPQRYSAYEQTFESIFTNFRSVTDPSVLNVQPYRLDVFQAPRTDAFGNLVTPNSAVGMTIDQLAILNQTETNAQITQGTHLKEVE